MAMSPLALPSHTKVMLARASQGRSSRLHVDDRPRMVLSDVAPDIVALPALRRSGSTFLRCFGFASTFSSWSPGLWTHRHWFRRALACVWPRKREPRRR